MFNFSARVFWCNFVLNLMNLFMYFYVLVSLNLIIPRYTLLSPLSFNPRQSPLVKRLNDKIIQILQSVSDVTLVKFCVIDFSNEIWKSHPKILSGKFSVFWNVLRIFLSFFSSEKVFTERASQISTKKWAYPNSSNLWAVKSIFVYNFVGP